MEWRWEHRAEYHVVCHIALSADVRGEVKQEARMGAAKMILRIIGMQGEA
jgi:hypothetical protein